MYLCAITEGLGASPASSRDLDRIIALACSWARGGVQLIQIREPELSASDLLDLSTNLVDAVRAESSSTRVLVNGPAALALTSGAQGVHLRSQASYDAVQAARHTFHPHKPTISVACHTVADVARARHASTDFIVFAPVFGKQLPGGASLPGTGLTLLAEACAAAGPLPVLALGGVTVDNSDDCLAAGAAGIAAIRLFQRDEWKALAATSRDLASHQSTG